MATGGVLGNGTKIGYSAASPVSWTKVPQLQDLKFPTIEGERVETTVHSTNGVKTYIAGLADIGSCELTLLADLDESTTPSHAALKTYRDSATLLWWRIEVPTVGTQAKWKPYEFQGTIRSYSVNTPINAPQTINVAIDVAVGGVSSYAATASSALS